MRLAGLCCNEHQVETIDIPQAGQRESSLRGNSNATRVAQSDVEQSDVEQSAGTDLTGAEFRAADLAGAEFRAAELAGAEPESAIACPTAPPSAPLYHVVAMLAAIIVPAVAVVVAIGLAWSRGWMGWLYLNLLIVGWLLSGMGITLGYHRLLTHRSFETYGWIRACLMTMGALALQASPLAWCSVHRKHHELSDHHGDPHSPHITRPGFWNTIRGVYYSHMGWLFTGHLLFTDRDRYVPDLKRDRFAVWIDKYYFSIWAPLSFLIPAIIGGVVSNSWEGFCLGMLWGGLVRIFIVHHITWSINWICHLFGSQDFKTLDQSRNNALCAFLGHGEGWHNNHHAFPRSARHGLLWWQLDTSYMVIRVLELLGLAWNVQRPTQQNMDQRRLSV